MFTHKAFAHEVLHMRCSRVKCLHMRYICRFLAQFQKNLFKIFANQASTPSFCYLQYERWGEGLEGFITGVEAWERGQGFDVLRCGMKLSVHVCMTIFYSEATFL